MKILTAEQTRQADAYTIAHEPIASIDLMERAALQCSNWIRQHIAGDKSLAIFCGNGNNGGDGLAIARQLAQHGIASSVYMLPAATASPDFSQNKQRLDTILAVNVLELSGPDSLPELSSSTVVVDALFGSGLTRPITGFAADVIQHINASGCITFAIDLPSGLMADQTVSDKQGAIIQADYTLTFAPIKLCFMLPENEAYIGQSILLDIGIHPDFLASVCSINHFIEASEVAAMLKKRPKFSHKGSFGHALLIAGSQGKAGAAILSARACHRSGAGLVTLHTPQCSAQALHAASPETMLSSPAANDYINSLPNNTLYQSIGIGPGIGMHPETATVLKSLIQFSSIPLVLDADALNILGENKTWLAFLPKGSILTPHPKEFERIAGKSSNHYERLELQRALSVKHGVYIVLKGAHTSISTPSGACYFNSSGNPGMATAGSGDVLTGIITGLMAQGYSPLEAAIVGVYLHGLAGDLALETNSFQSLIASDITAHLGKAFLWLQQLK